MLPNETRKIEQKITLSDWDIPDNDIGFSYLHINIIFEDSTRSVIRVTVESNKKAKQLARSIYNLIQDTVKHNHNKNNLFHLSFFIEFLGIGIYLGFYYLSYLLSARGVITPKTNLIIIVSLFILITFYYFSKRLKPYIVFESNKSERYEKQFDTLKNILISIYIIGFIVNLIF